VLEKSEAACRQMVHRAKTRVRDERPRFPVAADDKRELVERFLRALEIEDKEGLLAVVAPDATFVSDGGGRVSAVRRVVRGNDRVVRLFLGLERKYRGGMRHELAWVNDEPALLSFVGDRFIGTTSFDVADGRVVGVYRVMNPEKLKRLELVEKRWGAGGEG